MTHPSPGSMVPWISSLVISSLVGSMDSKCTLYGTAIRVQSCASLSSALRLRNASRTDSSISTARIEIIARLEEMMTQLIKHFEAKLKTRPQRRASTLCRRVLKDDETQVKSRLNRIAPLFLETSPLPRRFCLFSTCPP